jgi:glutamate:GABA antiporter
MSVLSYTLPFLFLFAVYPAVQSRAAPAGVWRTPGGRTVALTVGGIGLAATVVAVGGTLIPSPDARDQLLEALKLAGASAALIISGVAFYVAASRRARRPSPTP